jgi:hypothetical protein
MITPRSYAKEGFVDIDREDYKATEEDRYLKATQESQLTVIKDQWLDSQMKARQGLKPSATDAQ